jgi:hypothetical protein
VIGSGSDTKGDAKMWHTQFGTQKGAERAVEAVNALNCGAKFTDQI